MTNTLDTDIAQALPPSKTKVKKHMHELQDLGLQLTKLPEEKWATLELPENLREALLEYQRINKYGAQKRQLQYIGKLLRKVEIAPILAKLDAWNGTSRKHTAWLHQIEQWRDRLLEDSAALTDLLALYPQADGQRLRALIRNALKEKALGKPPKSSREIFRLLRGIIPAP